LALSTRTQFVKILDEENLDTAVRKSNYSLLFDFNEIKQRAELSLCGTSPCVVSIN